MARFDFETGSSTVEQFFAWINERHRIYCKRQNHEQKPWTKDPVMQQFKFTNVFRQLDKGTVALQAMLSQLRSHYLPEQNDLDREVQKLIVFNVIWYRLYNWHEHAIDPGWCDSVEKVSEAMHRKWTGNLQVFTAAHMVCGRPMELKVDTYDAVLQEAWDAAPMIVDICRQLGTMKAAFMELDRLPMVGKFIAYEMACDLRFTPLLNIAKDRFVWANVGPGAERGLRRLGKMWKGEGALDSMRDLWRTAPKYLEPHVLDHYPLTVKKRSKHYPPFELREIEHSLCEFDKYERTRSGLGRPRQKYNGTS